MTINEQFGPQYTTKQLNGNPEEGERLHLAPAFHNPVCIELADGRMLRLSGVDSDENPNHSTLHNPRRYSGWGTLVLTEVKLSQDDAGPEESRILATSTRGFMRFEDNSVRLEFNSTAHELEVVNRSQREAAGDVTVRVHGQDIIKPWTPRGPGSTRMQP